MKSREMKGLFLRRGVWHFQPSMVEGVRPAYINLETDDLLTAMKARDLILASPTLIEITDSNDAEIEKFLAAPFEAKKFYTESSKRSKRYNLKTFFGMLPGSIAIRAISRPLIQGFYDESLRTRDVHTAHKRLMDVRAFFKWLVQSKKVRENPAVGVVEAGLPPSPRVKFCTQEQVDRLLENCQREDLMFVLRTGFDAGLRKQEIINAVRPWFQMDNPAARFLDLQPTPTMAFNEHKRIRTIPMRDSLFKFLKEYGMRDPFMLRPDVKQGKSIYRYDFDLPLQELTKRCELEWVTPHVLRHTFASLLVQDGTSLFKVAKWLGDSITTTEKYYAHLMPNDDDVELRRKGKHRKKAS